VAEAATTPGRVAAPALGVAGRGGCAARATPPCSNAAQSSAKNPRIRDFDIFTSLLFANSEVNSHWIAWRECCHAKIAAMNPVSLVDRPVPGLKIHGTTTVSP
jgi:hypothetical protein